MRIMVTGANGMLGGDVVEVLAADYDVTGVDLDDFDLTDLSAVSKAMQATLPDLVVHCAAWTDVDGCERDPSRAFEQNVGGTWNLATAAAETGARLVYISTDFVFDGAKREPYTEFDVPNPLNTYAASKLAGEEAVRRLVPRHYIVRSAWLFGRRGRSFIGTILSAAATRDRLQVVSDQMGSPTYTLDLARAIRDLIPSGALFPGTYHLVNSGVCSWAELAEEALRVAGSTTRVEPISAAQWPSPTKRPPYSALRSRWLELQGIPPLREWRAAVESYVKEAV